MNTQTKETLVAMTPEKALQMLQEGNRRFVEGRKKSRDFSKQVARTSQGQYPFAVVLGCIDSRVPPELIFDQGIGDIFSVRIAGNFINEDILGSMEFAGKVVGSKLFVVLGHTSCGAVKGARDGVELGHLTGLVEKLKPAVEAARDAAGNASELDLDQVSEINVKMAVEDILERSPILKDLYDKGEIDVVGAMYDVSSGQVRFLKTSLGRCLRRLSIPS
jgi:carbonic anhydrase